MAEFAWTKVLREKQKCKYISGTWSSQTSQTYLASINSAVFTHKLCQTAAVWVLGGSLHLTKVPTRRWLRLNSSQFKFTVWSCRIRIESLFLCVLHFRTLHKFYGGADSHRAKTSHHHSAGMRSHLRLDARRRVSFAECFGSLPGVGSHNARVFM